MKKIIFLLTLCILFGIGKNVNAQDTGWGLGVMMGIPTGISAKYWIDEESALDFGFAYSFVSPSSGLSMHCDYVRHLFNVIKSDYEIPLYYGFGGRLKIIDSKGFIGARGVAGILILGKSIPIDAFFEVAPVFNLFPETSLHIDLAIGARYYFNAN